LSGKEAFLRSFSEAAEVIRQYAEKGDTISIVTHSDADGIAAGGTIGRAVKRLGAPFKISCEQKIDEKLVESIAAELPSLVVFTDLGSGYLDIIEKYLSNVDTVVLDHHLPVQAHPSKMLHINPIGHGLDGSREISGAGLAYLLARTLDGGNLDLSVFGIIGALADQQDKGEKRTFLGLNLDIEREAKEASLLQTKVDLVFYGYETRPLAQAIARTMSPFLPGLSGREDNSVAFLQEIGIELKHEGKWRTMSDITEEERKLLFFQISKYLLSEGCKSEIIYELVGTLYLFPKEEARTPLRDGREYASLLNACARMEKPSLGISICLGDRGKSFEEAENLFNEYRRKIAEYLDWVQEAGRVEEKRNIYVLRAGSGIDDRIIGVVASILLTTSMLGKAKPIVATATSDEGLIKVSARATEEMAKAGVDLGEVMMKAAEKFSGRGGGHDIAAGAYLQEKEEKGFLELVDEIVGRQLVPKK
jgi:RecJ-like exonuclease